MDPTFEIIKKCIDVMKSNAEITALVSDRIYDRVPEKQDGSLANNVISPYISLGSTQSFTDDYDCVDSATISLQWHCWSWGDGEAYSSALVRKLSFLIRKTLHNSEIELDQNGLVSLAHIMTAYNRASDGATQQASVNFEVIVDLIN
jgi:hypothetical protein